MQPEHIRVVMFSPATRLSILTILLPLLSFVGCVHSGGEVPHLNAAVSMTGEQIAPRSGPHPAGTLTLSDHEASDSGSVH